MNNNSGLVERPSLNALMVCKGNTCRSPMMVESYRRFLTKAGFTARVESAGLLSVELSGRPMNINSQLALQSNGIEPPVHVSRTISEVLSMGDFEMVFCVGQAEADQFCKAFPAMANRVHILNKASGGIPNPYRQEPEVYKKCFSVIDSAFDIIWNQ